MHKMEKIQEEIREKVRELLKEKSIDLMIGYEQVSTDTCPSPVFIRDGKDVERLVWNSFCVNNLAKYILKERGKVGVVAKGCDTRTIIGLIQEHKIKRDNVVILGVRCPGMVDIRKLEKKNIIEMSEPERKNDKLVFKNKEVPAREVLYDSCLVCKYPNPIEADFLFGKEAKPYTGEEYDIIKDVTSMDVNSRFDYWNEQFEKCIRCNACREICPFCYCERCIIDETMPAWVSRATRVSEVRLYHLIRFLHVAGRCVDCGECERACPMNLPLRKIVKKLEKDVKEMFGFEPGINLKETPVLTQYKTDDKEDFIR